MSRLHLLILAFVLTRTVGAQFSGSNDGSRAFYAGPGVTSAEILKARGYLVQEHDVATGDGYKLRLIGATNPLIKNSNKEPILFVHGLLEAANVFVVNSDKLRPMDLRKKYNFAAKDMNSTAKKLAAEPSARSLPILALNFGYPIYLLSRRGFPGSRQFSTGNMTSDPRIMSNITTEQIQSLANEAIKQVRPAIGADNRATRASPLINLLGPFVTAPAAITDNGNLIEDLALTFNTRFWNFSLDQQAAYDLPAVIDFILKRENKQKLSYVGHSAGGAIFLMSLIDMPEMADKISAAVLWSESVSVSHSAIVNLVSVLEPVLRLYVGPIPPPFVTLQFQAIAGIVCSNPLAQSTICEGVSDLALGFSGAMQPLKPEFVNTLLYSTSSGEIVQNLQCSRNGGKMHKFDYGSAARNLIAYNQTEPPAYDLSKVTLDRMSFYVGATDAVVTPADVQATIDMLPVSHKLQVINSPFNHESYFFHINNARLVNVPTFLDIIRISGQAN